jgi:hypothetical protein
MYSTDLILQLLTACGKAIFFKTVFNNGRAEYERSIDLAMCKAENGIKKALDRRKILLYNTLVCHCDKIPNYIYL